MAGQADAGWIELAFGAVASVVAAAWTLLWRRNEAVSLRTREVENRLTKLETQLDERHKRTMSELATLREWTASNSKKLDDIRARMPRKQ